MRQPRVRLAQQRKAAGYTQEGLAYELGVDRTTVTRWEAGETEPQPWIRRKLARVLGVSPERLTLLLTGEDGGGSLPATWRTDQARAERAHHLAAVPALRIDGADWTPTSSQELATLLSTSTEPAATGDGTVTRLVHEWLVAEPPQLFELQAGRRIGEGLVGKIERRVAELRHMDDFVAGGDLHGLVEQELRATAGLLHEGSYPEALGRRLLASVGELCQLAGWVLGDAGVYTAATHHFSIGLKAAHAANNVALAANLISTLAYQVSNVGNPRDAILLAQSADTGAQRQTTPRVQALLKERVAWASAKAGERRQTERALVSRVES